ncbi:MAG: ATP-binding cassette domain-containing protein [Clostridia bacterium]|nr:ATP-binding cassette domain-containing protein [Clostridia bacterium]
MLELRNVRKTYRTKAGEVHALDGISLTFPETGLVFISGKSGCGKTTLLNVIGGLDGIDEGEIFVQDKAFSTFSAKDYDSYRNTCVGFVFQEYNLLAEYSVEYNVKIAMELQGRDTDERALEALLREVDIEHLRNRKPSELSGGQRQRVAIARALVKDPRIIMADEPTGALDSETGAQVLDALKKLSKNRLVIVVSHDREFAEKYADRIVHLVDGRVVDDISFAERELQTNLFERENSLVVKEGADLSEEEKNALAKAVRERKKIEFTEKICYRDKRATGAVERDTQTPLTLKESKMKLRSSVQLGVKSLVVKPVRLAITVLISALAFAVFGLFDTIATFSTEKILQNTLEEKRSTVVTTADYIIDYEDEDRYSLKVSQATVDRLQEQTGGAVKGIFDFRDNTAGSLTHSQTILELTESSAVIGKAYYSNAISGFIQFDGEKELEKDGSFKDFNYKLIAGVYPQLLYENSKLVEESLYEVAISSYLADSIIYFLEGGTLDDKEIRQTTDLLGKTVSIGQDTYKIVGIIDCGEIPEKYDEIKTSTPYNLHINSLLDDYSSYINSSARKCFFVGEGFREEYNRLNESAEIFYAGNVDWSITPDGYAGRREVTDYVYDSREYGGDNILLFSGEYPADGKVALKDDEVLIHHSNLQNLFADQITHIIDDTTRQNVVTLLYGLKDGTKDENREAMQKILQGLRLEISSVSATIKHKSTKSGEKTEKQVRIVGAYFGVDSNRYNVASRYRLMMNGAMMETFGIYTEQAEYGKILFSEKSVRNGADKIVEYLTSEEGLALRWYDNSVLTVIKDNETMIRQAADLFLYAALALAVFSVFMLYNYISTSINNKRRSVGVLRGLGAGGKDIFLAFLSESLIIGVINGILAAIFSAVGCTLVNSYIMNTMNISVAFALFGIRQVLIITAISLLVSVLSSALPIVKISKKKPVDLIRQP